MAVDFAHPVAADLYADGSGHDWPGYINANFAAALSWLEGTAPPGLVAGAKRLNNGAIERFDGSAWSPVALNYLSAGGGNLTGPATITQNDKAWLQVSV